MRLRGMRGLFVLAALLPVVLMSVSGGGMSLFRCQLTGAVANDPCCPDEASPAGDGEASSVATVAATDCCLRETIAFARVPAEASAAPGHGALVAAVTVGEAPSPAATLLVSFVRAARPDIVPRPPLRLVKRSLLI